jgi:hypothetical protein
MLTHIAREMAGAARGSFATARRLGEAQETDGVLTAQSRTIVRPTEKLVETLRCSARAADMLASTANPSKTARTTNSTREKRLRIC